MTVPLRPSHWKRLLIWRHKVLWGYRVDLYLLLLICSVFLVAILAPIYIYYSAAQKAHILSLLNEYQTNKTRLEPLVKIAKERPLTGNERPALANIVIPHHALVGTEISLLYPSVDKITLQDSDVAAKYQELQQLGVVIANRLGASFLYLGGVAGGFMFIALLPIVLLAFYILNVFYSRDTQVVSSHPMFTPVMFQFVTLLLVPAMLLSILESTNSDVQTSFEHTNFMGLYHREATRVSDALMDTSEPGNYYISDALDYFFIPFLAWIACGLWMVRRLGGGLFLACSTATVVATVLLVFLQASFINLSGNVKLLEAAPVGLNVRFNGPTALWAAPAIVSFVVFMIGMLSRRWKSQLLCAGYTGTVVASCGLFGALLTVANRSAVLFILLLIVLITITSLVEALTRRGMFKLLYEPQ